MHKKSKVLIAFGLCLCMVLVLVPCFSLPIYAVEPGQPVSMSEEMWEWHKNAPTFFYEQSNSWGFVEYMWNGRFYRTFISLPTANYNSITVSLTENNTSAAKYVCTVSVDTVDDSPFLYTGYSTAALYPNSVDSSYLQDNYTIQFVTDTELFYYWNNSKDTLYTNGLYGMISLTKDNFYYNYPGQVYGKAGTPFFWNSYDYHTVLQASDGSFATGGTNNGNPMLFLSYNQPGDYVGLKAYSASSNYLCYGIFSTGSNLTNGKDTVAYTYSSSGNLSTSQLNINEWEMTTYIYYSPTPPKVIYSNLPIHYADGTNTPATESISKIENDVVKEELKDQSNNINNAVDKITSSQPEPDPDDLSSMVDVNSYVDSNAISAYMTALGGGVNNTTVSTMLTLTASLALVSYVLFGKRV